MDRLAIHRTDDCQDVVLYKELRAAAKRARSALPARLPPAYRAQLFDARVGGRPRAAVRVAGLCAWLPVTGRDNREIIFRVG